MTEKEKAEKRFVASGVGLTMCPPNREGEIPYEEAKTIALRVNNRVDSCRWYEQAYHFYEKNNQEERVPDNDVVVLKKTGKVVNFTTFVLDYRPEKFFIQIIF